MPVSISVPNLLSDPGFALWAPLGTAEPTNTVVGSKYTDAWPAGWLPVGATEDGSTFKSSTKVEKVMAAEFFDPLKIVTVERGGSFAFAMLDFVLAKLKWAMNGGALSVVSGTGATQLNKFEPPDPGTEVRSMVGWESGDGTVRIIGRQVFQTNEISIDFKKAPSKAIIPVQFDFEVPASAKPWVVYTAGTARA